MQIPELASNITMRLFLRPFEAVLSFKSLFEGVPDHRLSSNFTWLALFTPRFSWACFWGQNWEKKLRSVEASNIILRLFLRPFEAVLSFKSLFERVLEGLQGSYFVWRAKIEKYSHLITSLKAIGAFFFHSRAFEAVLSFKSLFEGVLEGLYGSYFVWRGKIEK